MTDTEHKVRTPFLPLYSEVTQLLPVWDGVPKSGVYGMLQAIHSQTGTPQHPVDWSEPDKWIGERLEGEDAALAGRIWEESVLLRSIQRWKNPIKSQQKFNKLLNIGGENIERSNP